jgi:hypothetical protein
LLSGYNETNSIHNRTILSFVLEKVNNKQSINNNNNNNNGPDIMIMLALVNTGAIIGGKFFDEMNQC